MEEDQPQHEGRFLEEAVKAMIRRSEEAAHDPDASLPVIRLSDHLQA